MTTKRILRCAIYTRKSSDEGLEQEFNTLQAQREACEAYIKSQAHEGWRVIAERFDDGGHSGGTLERPAMQRLLERVRTGRVDVILIYKIDRLTRSLPDFAKLAEEFDKYEVSFVSVTQQFNTTTSMGRLMLNVLLSFAQFEREIAGERIRDKIAASKKKGMWMGGAVPLGYDWKDRALVINQAEAKTVRSIFQLYIRYGNVRTVVAEARRLGLKTKVRLTSTGARSGGKPFCRGHVYAMLANPIYAGRMPHRGESYPAAHKPTINEAAWQKVQQNLTENRNSRGRRTGGAAPNLLTGLLFDADGNRFTPSHSVKNGRRYRYYIEQALTTGERPARSKLRRIPANEIDNAVANAVADLFANPAELLGALRGRLDASASDAAIRSGRQLSRQLQGARLPASLSRIRPLLRRVVIDSKTIQVSLCIESLRKSLSISPRATPTRLKDHTLVVPLEIRVRGGQMKLIIGNELPKDQAADPALLKALAQAHFWFNELRSGEVPSLGHLAEREGVDDSYIGRVIRLAFLSPDIQEAIVLGPHAPELTAKRLIQRVNLDPIWQSQMSLLIPYEHSLSRVVP